MRNSSLDMTQGDVLGGLLAFSIPTLIGNLLHQVYSLTDSIVVGRILGVEALAAVGCTLPIILLLALFGRPITRLFLEDASEELLRISYEYLLITAVHASWRASCSPISSFCDRSSASTASSSRTPPT